MACKGMVYNVTDNSGGKRARWIGPAAGAGFSTGKAGEIIKVSIIKNSGATSKVNKGDMHRAVIVRSKALVDRDSGSLRGPDNAVVLLQSTGKEPFANRVFGEVFQEVKKNGFDKVASLSGGVI